MQSLLRQNATRLHHCGRLRRAPLTLSVLSTIFIQRSAPVISIRNFASTHHFSNSSSKETALNVEKRQSDSAAENNYVYHGPLSATFRRLKIFSLASLGLSVTLAPFMFLIESALPMSARLALTSIALGTSGLSTSLVAWCAKPYVITLRRSHPDGPGSTELEMTTVNLALQKRFTKVYDPSFLIETRRPLARWELAQNIVLAPVRSEAAGSHVHPDPGHEETVAETRNEKGEVIGRWVVSWGDNGVGTCRAVGNVLRYFNVHEELLH
ncbi:hypothetical protein B0H34DRAFT_747162 [Crassisporium funariophilum]|nr:hypothetical protein B0H34DRAFT_747162 [Crassisporium funariophilum]